MSEPERNASVMAEQQDRPEGNSSVQPSQHQENSAPPSQPESHRQSGPVIVGQYAQQSYDMSAMAGALPANSHPPMPMGAPYGNHDFSHMNSPGAYQQHPQYYQRPLMFDPNMLARAQAAQQQQFMPYQYGHGPNIMSSPIRHQQGFPMQQQNPYAQIDPYAYAMNAASYAPLDPRFAPPSSFGLPAAYVSSDSGQPYSRRGSTDTGPVPSFPRGPPRKPKQSGHALWVGNLPPAATVVELKDHFSRDATDDIESVFLISKSNCAFVNYRTEIACTSAMNRFHDSRFNGVRLVCRLRRGNASSTTGGTTTEAIPESQDPEQTPNPTTTSPEDDDSADASKDQSADETTQPESSHETVPSSAPPPAGVKVPDKYFIVKSLTAQDLEASVRNKVWATQSHNEDALNRAYEAADNVYLIFSANKSGEYFGYARMASPIAGEPVNLAHFAAGNTKTAKPLGEGAGAPQSIPTPATATAPKGRIIDDSARGTIFWEADRDDHNGGGGGADEGSPEKEGPTSSAGDGQNWGRQFSVEWMSTARLPFYRTRGLRNPWNANREVKIARDGTELEPTVARRLVQMFHRPAGSQSQSQSQSNVSTPNVDTGAPGSLSGQPR